MEKRTIRALLAALILALLLLDSMSTEGVHYPTEPGTSKPIHNLNIIVDVSKSVINRSENFTLTYTIENRDKDALDAYGIQFEDRLSEKFRIINKTNPKQGLHILGININKLIKENNTTQNWTLQASGIIPKGEHQLFNIPYREYITTKGKRVIKFDIIYLNNTRCKIDINKIKVMVENNNPLIREANVTITSPNVCSDELFDANIGKPLTTDLTVIADDIEDKNLTYKWSVKYKNSTNNVDVFETREANSTHSWNLTPGRQYIFEVTAIDSECDSSKHPANITGNDVKSYSEMKTLSWELIEIPMCILILFVAFLLVIFSFRSDIFKFLKNKLGFLSVVYKYKIITKILSHVPIGISKLFIISIAILTTVVYWGLLKINYTRIGDMRLFFNSIAFYELYIYILIFLLFLCFSEDCLFEGSCELESRSSESYFWLINSVSMAFLLVGNFIAMSRSSPELIPDFLATYYSTQIQVSGTLLGVIIAVFAAVAASNNSTLRADEKFMKRFEYFVLFYGIWMGLSLWGLAAGSVISFTPLIEFNLTNLPNLASIFVFETSVLLIAPAVTSLYRLAKFPHEEPQNSHSGHP